MFRQWKLTAKLMVSLGFAAMLSFLITVSFITVKSLSLSKEDALSLMASESKAYSKEIQLSIDNAFDTARAIAYSTENMKKRNVLIKREVLLSMMEGMLERNPGYLGIWTVWEPDAFDGLDSEFKDSPGHSSDGRFIPYWNRVGGVHLEACVDLEGEWYTKARDTKKEVMMDPFAYDVGGKEVMLVSVCVPIIVNGKSLGVAGVDFSMEQIGEMFSKIRPFETGYAVLVTATGMIGAHPDSSKTGQMLKDHYPKEIVEAKNNNKTAHLEYKLETTGEKSIMTITPITAGFTGADASIFINAPLDKMLEKVSKVRNISIFISSFFLIVLLGLIFVLSKIVIIKPVNNVIAKLTDISEGEGDLTQRLKVDSKDELGILSDVFNRFMEKLQKMIKDITIGVETLSSSSTELSSISDQMSSGAKQTSDKSGDVSSASEEMTANMNSISASMEQSSTNTNTVATAAEEMNSTINEIARNAEEARTISEKAVEKVKDSADKMAELGEAAKAIGKVVETITDISDQVNLLSLNATIEAARAGEAGKGFAVVANEIKALAAQTSEASGDIKNRIENIQQSSSHTLKGISEISSVISNVNDIVATIATAVEEQSAATQEIAQNINQASSGIQEVNINVGQSSAVALEISKDIAVVNASAEDMAQRSEEVKLSAEDLSRLAEDLNNMVGRFKV
ncbi:MAG: methyl-accepting chemotaxis protein [Desulforegulaceae bacterium]|nr:methyl-accepting chemotaxis protein [Desulforegulaceae bacterium]